MGKLVDLFVGQSEELRRVTCAHFESPTAPDLVMHLGQVREDALPDAATTMRPIRPTPTAMLLAVFIPQPIARWNTLPVWDHLTSLLSLVL